MSPTRRIGLATAAAIALILGFALVVTSVVRRNDGDEGAAPAATTDPTAPDPAPPAAPIDPLSLGPEELAVRPLPTINGEMRADPPWEPGPWTEPAEAWSVDLSCRGSCDLVADASQVYALTRTEFDGHIAAYSAADGERRWELDIYQALGLHRYAGGLVIEHDGDLTIVDPADGSTRWSMEGAMALGFVGADLDHLLVDATFGPDEAVVVVGPGAEEVWRRGASGQLVRPCGEAVLLTGTDLTVLDATTGALRFEAAGSQVVCGDELIGDGERGGSLVLRDARTGEGVSGLEPLGTTALVGRRVVQSEGPEVASLDVGTAPPSGAWQASRPDGSFDNSYQAGSALVQLDYLLAEGIALDLADGTVLGEIEVGSDPSFVPTTRLLLSAGDDGVEAFDVASLEPRWTIPGPFDADVRLHVAPGGDRIFVLDRSALRGYEGT